MLMSLDRKLGNFQMSIATSLAFEGITHTGDYAEIGKERNEPVPPVTKIECLWVNLRTLIRNAANAFNSEDFGNVKVPLLIEAVTEDWGVIVDVMRKYAPTTELKLYVCTYQGLDAAYPLAKFRHSNAAILTPKQTLMEGLERGVLTHFTEKHPEMQSFNYKLEGKLPTVLLTHLALDLTSYYRFPDLKLLESHTGVIKERRKWNTKLQIDKKIVCIPFNITTLQIFGDGAMFAPQDIKARKSMIRIGVKRNWNSVTSYSRMIADIQLEYEPYLQEFVRRYK